MPEDETQEPKLPKLGPTPELPDLPDVPKFDAEKEQVILPPEVKNTEVPTPPSWEYSRPDFTKKHLEKQDTGAYLGIGVGLSAAYTIIGCTIVGWGIGWLFDRGKQQVIGQAIGTLVGAVVGLAGAIFTIVRAQNRSRQ